VGAAGLPLYAVLIAIDGPRTAEVALLGAHLGWLLTLLYVRLHGYARWVSAGPGLAPLLTVMAWSAMFAPLVAALATGGQLAPAVRAALLVMLPLVALFTAVVLAPHALTGALLLGAIAAAEWPRAA
jgi:hypothetical protein